jgi:HEPN domain-containing protein
MADRHADWLRQARRDLAHAEHSTGVGDYEWACFAAQQSAEKALKALYQWLKAVAWGHSVTMLLTNLPDEYRPGEELVDRARALDKHYVATRYPNGFERGAPLDYYTRAEAERSMEDAERIIRFCEDLLVGPRGGAG